MHFAKRNAWRIARPDPDFQKKMPPTLGRLKTFTGVV